MSRPGRSRRQAGFTLIELVIAMLIMGLLAAIALPNYNEYVRRSRIIEATSTLSDLRVRMEQQFLDARSYLRAGACPFAVADFNSPSFTFACAATATTFTLTATGVGGMSGFGFTVNEANQRQTTGVPAGWTAAANCWTVRKNGDCQ